MNVFSFDVSQFFPDSILGIFYCPYLIGSYGVAWIESSGFPLEFESEIKKKKKKNERLSGLANTF